MNKENLRSFLLTGTLYYSASLRSRFLRGRVLSYERLAATLQTMSVLKRLPISVSMIILPLALPFLILSDLARIPYGLRPVMIRGLSQYLKKGKPQPSYKRASDRIAPESKISPETQSDWTRELERSRPSHTEILSNKDKIALVNRTLGNLGQLGSRQIISRNALAANIFAYFQKQRFEITRLRYPSYFVVIDQRAGTSRKPSGKQDEIVWPRTLESKPHLSTEAPRPVSSRRMRLPSTHFSHEGQNLANEKSSETSYLIRRVFSTLKPIMEIFHIRRSVLSTIRDLGTTATRTILSRPIRKYDSSFAGAEHRSIIPEFVVSSTERTKRSDMKDDSYVSPTFRSLDRMRNEPRLVMPLYMPLKSTLSNWLFTAQHRTQLTESARYSDKTPSPLETSHVSLPSSYDTSLMPTSGTRISRSTLRGDYRDQEEWRAMKFTPRERISFYTRPIRIHRLESNLPNFASIFRSKSLRDINKLRHHLPWTHMFYRIIEPTDFVNKTMSLGQKSRLADRSTTLRASHQRPKFIATYNYDHSHSYDGANQPVHIRGSPDISAADKASKSVAAGIFGYSATRETKSRSQTSHDNAEGSWDEMLDERRVRAMRKYPLVQFAGLARLLSLSNYVSLVRQNSTAFKKSKGPALWFGKYDVPKVLGKTGKPQFPDSAILERMLFRFRMNYPPIEGTEPIREKLAQNTGRSDRWALKNRISTIPILNTESVFDTYTFGMGGFKPTSKQPIESAAQYESSPRKDHARDGSKMRKSQHFVRSILESEHNLYSSQYDTMELTERSNNQNQLEGKAQSIPSKESQGSHTERKFGDNILQPQLQGKRATDLARNVSLIFRQEIRRLGIQL